MSTAVILAALTLAGGCWARDYDAAHLAAHPAQRVAEFWIGDVTAADGGPLWLQYGFRLRTNPGVESVGFARCPRAPLRAPARCPAAASDTAEGPCFDDGPSAGGCAPDAQGSLTLEPRPNNGLRVRIRRLHGENDAGLSPDLGARAEDRVLDLAPVDRARCIRN